jgi:hypothetical protein
MNAINLVKSEISTPLTYFIYEFFYQVKYKFRGAESILSG